EQGLAQLKKIDSLKLCVLGFSRAPLAPDDVTSKSHFLVDRLSRVLILELFLKIMKNELDRPLSIVEFYAKM
ncbi:hypothetical protein PENTCL1PPCAC_12637, partial [Pristionchus entomophagus]